MPQYIEADLVSAQMNGVDVYCSAMPVLQCGYSLNNKGDKYNE